MKDAALCGLAAYFLVYVIYLCCIVPHRINVSASAIEAPEKRPVVIPQPPAWAFSGKPVGTAPKPRGSKASAATVEVAPIFGNIRDRAYALSEEIMENLWSHGWKGGPWDSIRMPKGFVQVQKMPDLHDVQANLQWVKNRSSYFRFRFLQRVIEMRDEFAQLHLRDTQLDEYLKNERMDSAFNIPPQSIQSVAERLRVLADKADSLAKTQYKGSDSESLNFSTQRISAESPQLPYRILITIRTKEIVDSGYIVVEFGGGVADVGTDFKGSTLVAVPREVENDTLKKVLMTYSSHLYALRVGDVPFTPSHPVHVIASGKAKFSVRAVTYFF